MMIDSEELKKMIIERLGVSGFKAVEVIRDLEEIELNRKMIDYSMKGGAK